MWAIKNTLNENPEYGYISYTKMGYAEDSIREAKLWQTKEDAENIANKITKILKGQYGQVFDNIMKSIDETVPFEIPYGKRKIHMDMGVPIFDVVEVDPRNFENNKDSEDDQSSLDGLLNEDD